MPLVLVLAVGVLLGTTIGCGLSAGDDSSDEIRIEGLSAEDVRQAGISLKVPVEEPAFDAKHAAEVALEKKPGGRIRQIVLARRSLDGLVWVVNFEPDSVAPIVPLGPGPASTWVARGPEDIENRFALTFVNAMTGEWVGSFGAGRFKTVD